MIACATNTTIPAEVPRTKTGGGGSSVCVTLRIPPELDTALRGCLKRACSWPVPPNWSVADWFEEMSALQMATACLSEQEYDPSYNVPFPAFIYQRVMARSLTRYRQEWCYASRFVPESGAELSASAAAIAGSASEDAVVDRLDHELLREALERLSQADRKLLQQLFWDDRKEKEIAGTLGITQQAVSLRKRGILRHLRTCLGCAHECPAK
jgi:RNA polymerase sigma factor (sigma-70 family)